MSLTRTNHSEEHFVLSTTFGRFSEIYSTPHTKCISHAFVWNVDFIYAHFQRGWRHVSVYTPCMFLLVYFCNDLEQCASKSNIQYPYWTSSHYTYSVVVLWLYTRRRWQLPNICCVFLERKEERVLRGTDQRRQVKAHLSGGRKRRRERPAPSRRKEASAVWRGERGKGGSYVCLTDENATDN